MEAKLKMEGGKWRDYVIEMRDYEMRMRITVSLDSEGYLRSEMNKENN